MKCLCCQKLFVADRRNLNRQKFCANPECRTASKRESQSRWLARPENQDHFRGSGNSDRVRAWRACHPGYWKRSERKRSRTLQDPCPAQVAEPKVVVTQPSAGLSLRTLQDLCQQQLPLVVGLISQLTGSPLQEDIAGYLRRLIAKGHDLLGVSPGSTRLQTPSTYDPETSPQTGSTPAHSAQLQLGGSSTRS